MAPALTSNSFLLTTPRPHWLTVSAKRTGTFSLFAKQKNDSSSSEEETKGSNNLLSSNPFRFNFGKVPDLTSLIPVVNSPSSGLAFGNQRKKDSSTVFVAGATGQAGVRIAQTLLRQGFSVRAGVPDLGAALELARLAVNYKIISDKESKQLNAVESTFENAEAVAKAIGNASKVVLTIGLNENGPTTEVSTSDALQVIQGAQLAGVSHVAVIYDGNLTREKSTNNVINGITSFFSNIFSSSQPLSVSDLLAKIVETDLRYTFIKTSLGENFSPESSYNVVISAEGSTGPNDYKVAVSKVASIVADVFSNTAIAENKVVEVFTDPSAPLRPIDELFSAIPEDGRRKAYAETLAKAKANEEAVEEAQEEVKKVNMATNIAEEVQENNADTFGVKLDDLLNKAKDIQSSFSLEKFSSQIQTAVQNGSEKPKVQIATVRGQAKARNLFPKKAAVKKADSRPTRKEEPKVESRNIFGGLFKQETIYVDE